MNIIIGADIVPTKKNYTLFEGGYAEALLGRELRKKLSEADFRVFNLEVPLTDVETPIAKCGPNLFAPTATIRGYKAIGADLLTLANNHIMDQGKAGLISTIKTLDESKIAWFGVGLTPDEAKKPYVIEREGVKIGFYACAEHEFSIVSDKMAGANPYDPLESFDHIEELRKKVDYLVVLYHGGREQYRYPSPEIQRVFRKMADKGADLIIAQHTHCIGCMEEYHGATLIYGQGNFIFDLKNNEYWNSGLLISILLKEKRVEIDYIPILKTQDGCICLASDEIKKELLMAFRLRSKNLEDITFLEDEYQTLADSFLGTALRAFHGKKAKTVYFRGLNILIGNKVIFQKYTKKDYLMLLNFIECEAHRELIISALKKIISTDSERQINRKRMKYFLEK